MKVVSIYSEIPKQGLSEITKIVYKTLNELDVETEEINLKNIVPFYEGHKLKTIMDIITKIQNADACILATSVNLFAPTALMKAFLEHCTDKEYKNMLIDKKYLIVSVSNTIGEREAAEYLYRVVNVLGGSELGRITMGIKELISFNSNSIIQEIIEKNVEDFYKLVRQNRKTFMSSEAYICNMYYNQNQPISIQETNYNQNQPSFTQETNYNQSQPSFTQDSIYRQQQNQTEIQPQHKEPVFNNMNQTQNDVEEIKSLLNLNNKQPKNLEKAYTPTQKQNNFNKQEPKIEVYEAQFEAFAERQEEDIKDIVKMFSQQMKENIETPINNTGTYKKPIQKPTEVIHREKSCKQMMQNLPHHFQPHLATDIRAVFQFSITGDEVFEGYLAIDNSETYFKEGTSEKPDIYIYTNTNIMKDILRGKYSTQKAFMTGQLKVRGNFVLLNKLDQLFKKMN